MASLDHVAALTALGNRLLGTTVCTTGSTSLSATATGYARASGSFLDDGFAVGMELTDVSGFSVSGNNQATTDQGRIITGVTATALTCSGCAVDADGSGRTITVGIPFQRSWENVDFRPVVGFPYVDEDYVPGPTFMIGFPYNGSSQEERGMYVVNFYGLAGKDATAVLRYAMAIRDRFAPGTNIIAGDHTLRVMGRPAGPTIGQVIPLHNGSWAVCPVRIPFYVHSTNAVAA